MSIFVGGRKRKNITFCSALVGAFFFVVFSGDARAATAAPASTATIKPKTTAAKAKAAAVKAVPKPVPLEIGGWVPYWRTATGTADAIAHIDVFKEISPFGYAVKNDGSLVDQMHIDNEPWQALVAAARAKKVKVIPTIMWGSGDAIHKVLKNAKLRNAHIAAIVREVRARGWDGIDIDYEGKKADTKNYFSIFLRDLYRAMGKKMVSCTIETRIPLADRFVKIPPDTRYANDFAAINRYCDRVRIMAYDQGTIDLKLNKAADGGLYMPIADPLWVEKAVRTAMKTIAKKKISIGVATYGYESEIAPYGRGFSYNILWSFNPRYATELAARLGIVPNRNRAGEMSFLYSPAAAAPALPPDDTASSSAVAPEPVDGNATPVISPTATTAPITAGAAAAAPVSLQHLVWWSDAAAIRDKYLLARKLGVRGIAIFKIDGGEDPAMWDALK